VLRSNLRASAKVLKNDVLFGPWDPGFREFTKFVIS
jgi:hypothetical protein